MSANNPKCTDYANTVAQKLQMSHCFLFVSSTEFVLHFKCKCGRFSIFSFSLQSEEAQGRKHNQAESPSQALIPKVVTLSCVATRGILFVAFCSLFESPAGRVSIDPCCHFPHVVWAEISGNQFSTQPLAAYCSFLLFWTFNRL